MTITIYRSAVTGRFVSKAYAKDHPDTTVSQTVRKAPKLDDVDLPALMDR